MNTTPHAPSPYVHQPDPTGKRWRYITVRTGFLFNKGKTGEDITKALHALRVEYQGHRDRPGPRWVWYFRAYLTEQEHIELARRFKAKERKR